MRSTKILVSFVLVLLLSGMVLASDYTPRTGVLSPEDVDFGGKTVNILVQDLTWVAPNGGNPTDERIAAAEELFNVKINLGAMGSVDNVIARIMANDSAYDLLRFNHRSGYYPLVSQGMLLASSDYLPEEYFEELPRTDRYALDKLVYEGNNYGFGVMYGKFNASMMIMNYNQDIIDESGLEDPYDLWTQGRWNYEVFEEMIVALTIDTDGDGAIDQHGFTNIANSIAAYRFMPFNGAEVAKKDENGKWVYALNQPEAINALNIIAGWRDLGVMGDNAVFGTSHLAGLRHGIAAGDNIGIVPFPTGPDVEENQWPVFDFSSNFLPVNSAYPEGLIALADFLFREEDTEEYFDFYVNSYMTNRNHMHVYETGADSWLGEGDAFQNSGIWDVTNDAVTPVVLGERGAAAAVDEVAQQAQAALDDLFRQ